MPDDDRQFGSASRETVSCRFCGGPNAAPSRFCSRCGRALTAANASPSRSPAYAPERQLRQITVVFCDLAGSAALSAALDPEDLTDLVGNFHRCVTGIMEEFGGYVARYVGDGSLTYFGYPKAGEDDAERAVRASLAAIEAVSRIAVDGGSRLHSRIGIATGITVVGDVVGVGDIRGFAVVGEAPNLAARLQEVAEPDTVVVEKSVLRLVRQKFEFVELGPRAMKGWADPVQTWRAVCAIPPRDRFAAMALNEITPMSGRMSELARLRDIWNRVTGTTGVTGLAGGERRGVIVLGEPGIGKSRLVHDFVQPIGDCRRVALACLPRHEGVPLHPFVHWIESVGRTGCGDGAEAIVAKLRETLDGTLPADFELIAALIGSAPNQGRPAAQLAPHRRRDRTMQAILNFIEAYAGDQALLVTAEDLHWADAPSLELLDLLTGPAASGRAMILMTSRPEGVPAWITARKVDPIRLNALAGAEAESIVRSIAGNAALPDPVIAKIVARCDGNPLFLEEVTKAVLEDNGRGSALLWPVVPPTIHASLLSRLDGLGDARPAIEAAAAIGREFGSDLLRWTIGASEEQMQDALARLIGSGLVFAGEHGEYSFKHVLIQDAAYGTIARERRRELHGRIADALETRLPEVAAANPSAVAQHCVAAGWHRKAVVWWLRAGTQSLCRSASAESFRQLNQGLELLQSLPEDDWRIRSELDLRLLQGKISIATRGHAAPETGEAFEHARGLCGQLSDPPQLLTTLFGQWTNAVFRARLKDGRKQAENLLAIGEARQDPVWRLIGCYSLGFTLVPLGEFALAAGHLERGISLYDEGRRQDYAAPVVGDPRVVMRTYLSLALLTQGKLDAANVQTEMLLGEARSLGQMWTLAQALYHAAYCAFQTGAPSSAMAYLEELDAVVQEFGFLYFDALGTCLRGWCLAAEGETEFGIQEARRGLGLYLRTSSMLYVGTLKRMEAHLHLQAGDLEQAWALANEVTRLMHDSGAYWDYAELMRLKGELMWRGGDVAGAADALRSAIEIAVRQGAGLFRTRAEAALARLLGPANEARGLRQADAVTP